MYSGAAGTVRVHGLGKSTITMRCAAAAATAFYFAKSWEDRGLAGLTPYSVAACNENQPKMTKFNVQY